ncbi:MAG: hypothetical protein AB4368_22130 [Xenococcaceae cyanobacterium]
MGRDHCIEYDCAIVWVKQGKEEVVRGTHVRYAWNAPWDIYNREVSPYEVITVIASHFSIKDNATKCFVADSQYEVNRFYEVLERQKIQNYKSNLLDAPYSYRTLVDMSFAETSPEQQLYAFGTGKIGTIELVEQVYAGANEKSEQIWNDESILWQGYSEGFYIGTYVSQPGGYYDSQNRWNTYSYSNFYNLVNCEYTRVVSDYHTGKPGKRRITRQVDTNHDRYFYLTFHNYQGIPGKTHTVDNLRRVQYLDILNPQTVIQFDKWRAYKIEKKPWLERLEVVDFAYNFSGIGILNLTRNILEPFSPIPENSLNIYVTNNVSDLIIPFIAPTGFVEPAFPWETELKYQIDNEDSNEPIEYYVTCGCEIECPPGTCKVDCGDHICCYDNNGIAVAEIPKEQLS